MIRRSGCAARSAATVSSADALSTTTAVTLSYVRRGRLATQRRTSSRRFQVRMMRTTLGDIRRKTKTKDKRQKTKGKRGPAPPPKVGGEAETFAFCLLSFVFCLSLCVRSPAPPDFLDHL